MSLVHSKVSLTIFMLILSQNIVQAKKLTQTESWGYGTLVGITVGLCGFLGACLVIGCRRSKKVDLDALNKMLISFAIGTLIGDAFIHLIPNAFRAHSHKAEEEEVTTYSDNSQTNSNTNQTFYNASVDSQEHAHAHNEGELTEENVKVLCAMLCLGYFIFFVMENFMHIIGHHTHSHSHSHSIKCEQDEKQKQSHQSEGQNATEHQKLDEQGVIETQGNSQKDVNSDVCQEGQSSQKEVNENQEQQIKIQQMATQITETESKQLPQEKQDIKDIHLEEKVNKKKINKIPGFLNLFSDFLHNILDGLAIGVAFGDGDSKIILSTFIAVLAHEIPQEVGDAGILLNSGFSSKWVLLSNGFVNFSALLGTFIGLGIGSINEEATTYLYAFIAANFIYIAASDMLPQIIEENRIKYVLIHGFLMLLGMGIMWGILELEAVTGEE